MPGQDRRSRAWATIDYDATELNPFCWKHLLSMQHVPRSQDLLYGIGFSTVFSLSAVYFLPGASAGMVILAVAAHCCTIVLLEGTFKERSFQWIKGCM